MRMKRSGSFGVLRIILPTMFGVLVLVAFRSALATPYVITDLGTLGGANSQANGINNVGKLLATRIRRAVQPMGLFTVVGQ